MHTRTPSRRPVRSLLRQGVRHRARPGVVALAAALLATLAVAVPGTADAATTRAASAHRIAGASRTATATELSRTAWPSGAATVVIARADAYADALAGSPLAAAMDAPVLLTSSGDLSAEVAAEVARLGADHAVLLGGEGAVGPAVAAALADRGLSVERIGGASRYETAAAIARRVRELAVDPLTSTVAYVVEGANADPMRGWPDAVAVAPLAAQLRVPILLTSSTSLPEATSAALADFTAAGLAGITIVGGGGAVSGSVEADLIRINPVVERISGANRYATSVLVARQHLAEVDASTMLLASGRNWPDALVAGPAAAAMQAPLVLTDPTALPGDVATLLGERELTAIGVVGGPGAVQDTVLSQAQAAVASVRADDFPATGAGAAVMVPAGATMVLDRETAELGRVEVHGTLVLEPGADLRAESIAVHGRLLSGSPLDPIGGDVRIRLRGVADEIDREGVGTGGLEVHGGTLSLVGITRPVAWTRLADTAGAGTRSILLARAPNWRAGDQIVLAATGLDPDEAEQATVESVDGPIVRLREPLAHDHVAVRDTIAGTVVEQAGEVGLLTRPIRIDGAGAVGGHVMAMRGGHDHESHGHAAGQAPTVLLRAVHLGGLGQTGVLGRYPFHVHMGGATPGVRLDTVTVTDAGNRCVTIHGTRRMVVTRLVASGTVGHCVFFEDGAETGNLVNQSLVLGQREPAEADRLLDTDASPAGIWVQHPSNTLLANAAAGGVGHGIWLDLPSTPTGPSEDKEIRNRTAPGGVVARNVAHSQTSTAFRSGTGLRIDGYTPPETFEVTDTLLWQNEGFGAWLEAAAADVVLRDAVVVGNRTGVQIHGATVADSLVVGRSSHPSPDTWTKRGVGLYHGGGHVRGVTFANFTSDVSWHDPVAVSDATHSHQFISRVEDVTMIDVATPMRLSESPTEEGTTRWIGVIDLDGSLTGTAATYVSHQPMAGDVDCTAIGGGQPGWRCATTDPTTNGVIFQDVELGGALAPASVRDARGRQAGAMVDDTGRAEFVLAEGVHEVNLGRVPTYLETIVYGQSAMDLTATVSWPHDDAWVYRGWGEWARPVTVRTNLSDPGSPWWHDSVGGQLRMTLDAGDEDGGDHWSRWLVCAEQYCGDGVGSAYS